MDHHTTRFQSIGVTRWAWMTLAIILLPLNARAASCGASTVVQPNDTLSSIAARCDVTEAMLLGANPAIGGSGDLRVGASVQIPGSADGAGTAISRFSRRAGDAMGALADDVGSTVGDLLDKNPDLKRRLDKLGDAVGLTGGQATAAAVVLPRSGPSGTTVTVTANGLPASEAVAVGVGAPGAAYRVVGQARSGVDGAMQTKVPVPDAVQPGSEIVFSLVIDGRVAARTERFAVTRASR